MNDELNNQAPAALSMQMLNEWLSRLQEDEDDGYWTLPIGGHVIHFMSYSRHWDCSKRARRKIRNIKRSKQ